MADIFTKAQRSAVMARIRGSGNAATELRMMALLRAHGITGWRRRQRVFGKPDFVFRRERVALFVDGCFWHGCPRHATRPKTRAAFWAAKLARNQARDRAVTRTLRRAGWTVLRVWECSLTAKHWPRTARRVVLALGQAGSSRERPARFCGAAPDFPPIRARGRCVSSPA